ncbi:MAG: M20 family metallopeptidase [Actinomycetia bacterium]|nr:M20 family metallopeptidase [Actinomycetes bacterium]
MANTSTSMAERVAALVHIPSVNPLQAGPKSGEGGERAISAWMADRTEAMGADVTVDVIEDGRANVYARFEGDSERAVTIDVHLDTVGVEHMTDDPFDGRIEDGRVYGRGSVDTKASLAVVLAVLEELQAEGKRPVPTVNVVGTIAEEAGGLMGAAGYRDWLQERGQRINQLIVAEPTLCAPVHGHKGGMGLELVVHGHAAHSSKPHLGQNAISAAARIVLAVDAEQERLQALEPATAVGNGTIAVNEIEGGLARNIIPDRAELYVGRRVAPGEDPEELFEQLSALIEAASAPLEVDVNNANDLPGIPAFYQDPDSPLILTLAQLGNSQPECATYGSNALRYPEVADEIVVFGPGSIDQAHQAVEWIDITELDKVADIYRAWFRA